MDKEQLLNFYKTRIVVDAAKNNIPKVFVGIGLLELSLAFLATSMTQQELVNLLEEATKEIKDDFTPTEKTNEIINKLYEVNNANKEPNEDSDSPRPLQ